MNTVDLYKTRTMLGAIEVIPTNESFLLDTFCPNSEAHPTQKIDVDFVKGKKKIAPFVSKKVNGVQVERNVVATKSFEPADIKPFRPLTVETLEQRLAGEALYSDKTPAQRAAELLTRDLRDLKDMVDRRKEWIIAQTLFTGKFTANVHSDADNYIEEEFDYGHTLNDAISTSTLKWTAANKASCKPLDDLQAMVEAVATGSGKYPTIVIMGSKALEGFLGSDQVNAYFDKWNFNYGSIEPSIKSTQVQYVGRLYRPNVEIYTYAETFIDEVTGALTKFVPDDKVVVACPNLFTMHYAAVTQLENGVHQTYMGELVPKYWSIEGDDVAYLRVTSKPVPVAFDVDAWAIKTVI